MRSSTCIEEQIVATSIHHDLKSIELSYAGGKAWQTTYIYRSTLRVPIDQCVCHLIYKNQFHVTLSLDICTVSLCAEYNEMGEYI